MGRRIQGSALSLVAALALVASLSGCGIYSFTGASIPAHLNTIAIPLVENNTTSPLTNLSDVLTQEITDRFVGLTKLRLQPAEEEADVVLTARLQQYVNQPASVSADDRAALNRVSITVNVLYYDRVEETELLSRSFTGSAEYDPLVAGIAGEEQAAQIALENVADDIFTAATSNW